MIQPSQDTNDRNRGCLILLGIGLVVAFIGGISRACDNNANTYSPTVPVEKQWYEGGNLHKAKIRDWKLATDANKLATCGDFVAHTRKSIKIEDAYGLMKCIDEAVRGHQTSDDWDVTQVAAMCEILLTDK